MIEIRTSPLSKGEFRRGVFATCDIPAGQLIHEAPVVAYDNEDDVHIEKTILADYVFQYGSNHTAILLGYGSLFNHSYQPNAIYDISFEKHTFDFFAYRDIRAGEEILINYNGDPDCDDILWFMEDEEDSTSS